MDRAFSNLTIRSISEDRREFEGWASTPTTDRQNDQLLPEGAEFRLPIPVLLDHNHTQVCGEVYRAEVSKAGIKFWARVKKIMEPGAAKDFVDYCWSLIKNSLRPMVSVGFQPLEYEHLENGGLRFTRWSWYELSAVAIGANPDAKVTGTKAAKVSVSALRSPPGHISITEHQRRVRQLEANSRARVPTVQLRSPPGHISVGEHERRRQALNATLARGAKSAAKPGGIRIIKTGPRVVKLPGLKPEKASAPAPVVKLSADDVQRARRRLNTRVVKLGR
jgi:hypothetical protein